MHARRALILVALAPIVCSSLAADSHGATVLLSFDQDVYYVTGPGDEITARVTIDTNLTTPELDAVARGLYSFSLGLSYPDAKATVDAASDVVVPAELDNFGFDPGAFRELAPGAAGVKGNVDQSANPLEFYNGTLLATFTITNLAPGPDSYLLNLNFFNTVGPNEQFYLNAAGSVLDPGIMFGSALVIVVPEPGTGALLAVAIVLLLPLVRRRGTWPRLPAW